MSRSGRQPSTSPVENSSAPDSPGGLPAAAHPVGCWRCDECGDASELRINWPWLSWRRHRRETHREW